MPWKFTSPSYTEGLEVSAEKNCSALSKKELGNLRCNMKVEEASEAGRLCLRAHSSHVLVFWIFVLLTLMLLAEIFPFPNKARAPLRFDLTGISLWAFLASGPVWLPSDGSLAAAPSCANESDWAVSKPCLQDFSKESSISVLSSCCTTPLFWSHP